MNRTIANIIIDIIAAFLFLGMIATGYLLRYPLPPGSNRSLSLWGFTRHQWGDVHFWISLGLLLVLVIHSVLHWNWIVTVIGKRCHLIKTEHPSLIRTGILSGGIVILMLTLFAWAAQTSVIEIARPMRGNHFAYTNQVNKPVETIQAQSSINPTTIEFWKDIYPLFENHCLGCHGPQKQLANFRIDRKEDFFGSNDRPALVIPGQNANTRSSSFLNFLHSDAYKIIQRHDIAGKLSVPVGLNLCQSYACWKALTEKHRQQVQPTL